jgi:tetratricopeptide (TPR) repeat protein
VAPLLALAGQTARAKSAFVSVLSRSPRDARALTNLGNLALVRGDAQLALAYYGRAARAAPRDPGIDLDRAVASLVLGDTDAAQRHAARAVRMLGGRAEAAALLGLVGADSTAAESRAADATRLTPEEIDALLRRAPADVPMPAPADSFVGGGGVGAQPGRLRDARPAAPGRHACAARRAHAVPS